jgi:putative copper resistance protein D
MMETGLITARFVHYVALAALFGSWAYAGFATANVALRRRFGRMAIVSAVVVLLSSVAVLAATIAGLGGDIKFLGDADLWATVIGETDFGKIWSVRLVLATCVIAIAIGWAAGRGAATRTVGLVMAGALVTLIAWTGHAAIEEGAAGQVHRLADALHLVAAVVWIGALMPMLWLLARPNTAPQAAQRLTEFHAVGLIAVLTLLVTGAVNSYFLVGTPEALVTTTYGQLLAAKLGLFAAMAALAARNRFRYAPALAQSVSTGMVSHNSAASLQRSIRGELVLGVLVLAIVAILGSIAPGTST